MLKREEIVSTLKKLTSDSQIITDEKELRRSSVDRFKKYEMLNNVWTNPMPAAVVMAKSKEDIVKVLQFCNANGINVVPRTGRTATEGGLETVVENSVVLDGSSMKKIIKLDTYSMEATAECGVCLQDLDNELRKLGYTTGHSPQSKPIAQMGGLVATRSIGQFSTLYGGIEDMVVGLEVVFPDGHVARIKNIPRRSTGPDIRHIVIGNEGALCYVTEVTVKVFKFMPENNKFLSYKFDEKHMKLGFEVLREIMVEGYKPSIARIYDPDDAQQHHSKWLEKGKSLLIFMAEGPKGITEVTQKAMIDIIEKHKEFERVDNSIIEAWFNNLNWGQDKIDKEFKGIMDTKNIGHTTEVSGSWGIIHDIYKNCIEKVRKEFPRAKDLTMLGGHSSHSYINGTNLYFVYDYNIVDCKPEEEAEVYHHAIMKIICEEVLRLGGSIVHHHGMGKARSRFAEQEYGSSYYMIKKLKAAFDPNDIMNKGCLIHYDNKKNNK